MALNQAHPFFIFASIGLNDMQQTRVCRKSVPVSWFEINFIFQEERLEAGV
jgi:hypothetical protein